MGTYDLIDDYLARLRAVTGWHTDPDGVVDEMQDHLLSAAEALEASGTERLEAQQLVLDQFGPPDEIAHALATGPRGAPAIPTRSTVSGATLALVGGAMWLGYALASFAMVHLYDRANDNGDPDSSSPLQLLLIGPWGMSLIAALALLFLTGLILMRRHGGFGWVGRLGMVTLALAIPAGLIGWFIPGWGTLLAVGAALLAVELLRAGITPRAPTAALAAGPAIGFLVWGGLRFVELGSRDQYGDYPAATIAGIAVGCAVLAAGLYGIGSWLYNEQPVDAQAPGPMRVAT